MQQLIQTILGIVVAVGVSALLFVGANKWADQALVSWRRFAALSWALGGAVFGVVLVGNRLVAWRPAGDGGPDLTWLLPPLLGVLFGLWGWLGAEREGAGRVLWWAGGGVVLGLIVGVFARSATFPAMRIVPLVAWPAAVGLLWGGWNAVRGRRFLPGAVSGATVGWLAGAFGVPTLGGGTRLEAMMGWALLVGGVGLRIGIGSRFGVEERRRLVERARTVIFLAPALGFIGWALVFPTIRTVYMSFLDRRAEQWVGLANYQRTFTDPTILKVEDWPEIFRSELFYWSVGLALVGLIAGRLLGRQSGRAFEVGGLSVTPLAASVFLFAFAAFSKLRGTIFNNLWWIFTVTILATGLGLAIAVLADRARFESVAKSIIFMPMAISFVGAGIIWRFMYIARPPDRTQTGVLNALWVWLGRVSHSNGRYVAALLLGVALAALLYVAWRGYQAGSNSLAIGPLVTAAPVVWLIYRFLGPGISGFQTMPDGTVAPDTVLFLQEIPFNNVWLMVPFIWIYVGFCMVIFSAAIKGVPSDLIEAAKVDGATEAQTFWRVVVPQIAPTIGVVVTTLIVVVAKVFDIVKVMTNGNFDTQVLANEMWQRAFTELDFGLGSALAVLIFVAVLPIMYLNIRRMQKEAL
jgi:alpha-glucoside transport system permease protein